MEIVLGELFALIFVIWAGMGLWVALTRFDRSLETGEINVLAFTGKLIMMALLGPFAYFSKVTIP